METSKYFDLQTAIDVGAVAQVQPQIRFLWQNAGIQDSLLAKGTELLGIPFFSGYDGLNLHPVRRKEDGWWRLVVTKNYSRLDYSGEEGLKGGVDAWLSFLEKTQDGHLYSETGTWIHEDGKIVKKMKKMDMHIHTYGNISLDQMTEYMKEMMQVRGYCGLGFVAALRNSAGAQPDANETTLELKRRFPNSFAFASLDHEKDFVEQTKAYMEAGFDGIKMLEGKPSIYRHYGCGFEGDRMDAFFAYAEEHEIPIVLHNNDPRANWDPSNPKADALREKGWYYGDGEVPSQEEFFRMLEDVFDRHPNLRVGLSHMGFYYDNLPRVSALMDKCPNLYMDLTPAVEVFMELSLTPDATKEFFRKYGKRMFYGTDTSVNWAPGSRIREFNDQKIRMMDVFFQGDAPEVVAGKYPVVPMEFDQALVEDIYYYNALRFLKKI